MSAFRDGIGRVRRAPALIAGVWLTSLAMVLGPAVVLRGAIEEHFGSSMAADSAVAAINFDWWNEFLAQASGLGQTFVPAVLGFAAVLKNMSHLADATPLRPAVAMLVGAHLLLSLFLSGGLLDRLARDRAVGSAAFFSACGVWFCRFLRLALIAGPLYGLLFLWLHRLLFDVLFVEWTRDLTAERSAFAVRLALYIVFTGVVCGLNLILDYAKIRAVVEDRRSMIGALVAGARFVVRHPAKTALLYAANIGLAALVAGVYYLLAPGAASPLLAFAVGQFYIVLRVVVRLQFIASQTALFQQRLAHAGYVARPVPRWPDSPAADAIGPA